MHQPPPTPEDAFLVEVSHLARRYARLFILFLFDESDDGDADDIAQDIVLECLANLRNGNGAIVTSGLACLVRTMVMHRLYNEVRANRRRDSRALDYVRELTGLTRVWMAPELGVDVAELETFLDRTIASLPPVCRRVYVMVREDNMTYKRVARTLGISRNTVREYVVTAQRRLRAALLELGIASLACRAEQSETPATGNDQLWRQRSRLPELPTESAA